MILKDGDGCPFFALFEFLLASRSNFISLKMENVGRVNETRERESKKFVGSKGK